MPATFDKASAGSAVAGPTTDSLTVPWAHNPVANGVLAIGFEYDTTAPSYRSIHHTITYNGQAMKLLGWWAKGWGLPSSGFVEAWGIKAPTTGSHNISVGLSYNKIAGDPWAPTHATFSKFSGGSVSFAGAKDFGRAQWRGASSKMMSLGINAFQNHLSFLVLGSDGAIDAESVENNKRFLDSGKHLLLADMRGPGAFRAEGDGGNWGMIGVEILAA